MYQVITRALSDTLQNLFVQIHFTQNKYSPWSCCLFSATPLISLLYFPALLLFMHFWVLHLITSKPAKNMKEWIYTHLLQVAYCIFFFFFPVYNRKGIPKVLRSWGLCSCHFTLLCHKDATELLKCYYFTSISTMCCLTTGQAWYMRTHHMRDLAAYLEPH